MLNAAASWRRYPLSALIPQVQELHCLKWQALRLPMLLSLFNDCRALLEGLPPERAAAVGETAALAAGVPAVAGMVEALRANLAMAMAAVPPPANPN